MRPGSRNHLPGSRRLAVEIGRINFSAFPWWIRRVLTSVSKQPSVAQASHCCSEHSVAVGSRLRDRLNDVPMLDHLAVLKPVDIDNGKSARARLAHGMIMDNHIIAIGED